MSKPLPSVAEPLYAVIDLGSNSFHMLIARLVADSVQVVDKVKRKVRLASGLDDNHMLDDKSMARGWECLSFFAERLQDIPRENIRVVATATLRLAKNADVFLQQAETVLGFPIEVITGEQEARHIYLGAAHTTCGAEARLVIDIGGASTELVVGQQFEPKIVRSLDIGCVTFNHRYFSGGVLSEQAFNDAIRAAKTKLSAIKSDYQQFGWDLVLGVSGTLQAAAETLSAQGLGQKLTLENLRLLKTQVIAGQQLNQLNIVGLQDDRKPVFAPGLAILIAILEEFAIDEVQLAGGAIREGILYELLPNMRNMNIRQRTLMGLIERFSIDEMHAYRVANLADKAVSQVQKSWQLSNELASILQSACVLHEIGLLLEFKRSKKHAQYILANTVLAGFSHDQRLLLTALVANYKTDINLSVITEQSYTEQQKAIYLIVLLRLAVILAKRRRDDAMPDFILQASENTLVLKLPQAFCQKHPLISAELKQECKDITACGFHFSIERN
ncbi:guanosine-5'-triphosphate,3'-diphosphate pyrophosphatase [Thalassotalea maritima]|uniref:Ppx/GppA phosphatase family protein n=1 Tax=Thalassotalea maritima TaxID=3242416 RepID=UPI003527CC2C